MEKKLWKTSFFAWAMTEVESTFATDVTSRTRYADTTEDFGSQTFLISWALCLSCIANGDLKTYTSLTLRTFTHTNTDGVTSASYEIVQML